MSIADQRKAISEALDVYRQKLDSITDEQFTETPPGGGWSYAEVYSHILQSNLGSLIAMERCCRNTGIVSAKGLNWMGKLVFFLGAFPPMRLKSPAAIASLAKRISREEARNLIVKLRKRVEEMMPIVAGALENSKISHPRLGMLNARQWFRFILIHTRHHIRQLNRIEKKFSR